MKDPARNSRIRMFQPRMHTNRHECRSVPPDLIPHHLFVFIRVHSWLKNSVHGQPCPTSLRGVVRRVLEQRGVGMVSRCFQRRMAERKALGRPHAFARGSRRGENKAARSEHPAGGGPLLAPRRCAATPPRPARQRKPPPRSRTSSSRPCRDGSAKSVRSDVSVHIPRAVAPAPHARSTLCRRRRTGCPQRQSRLRSREGVRAGTGKDPVAYRAGHRLVALRRTARALHRSHPRLGLQRRALVDMASAVRCDTFRFPRGNPAHQSARKSGGAGPGVGWNLGAGVRGECARR